MHGPAVEAQLDPGAGTDLEERDRPIRARTDIVHGQAHRGAAPRGVGLHKPLAEDLDERVAVLGAEGAEFNTGSSCGLGVIATHRGEEARER